MEEGFDKDLWFIKDFKFRRIYYFFGIYDVFHFENSSISFYGYALATFPISFEKNFGNIWGGILKFLNTFGKFEHKIIILVFIRFIVFMRFIGSYEISSFSVWRATFYGRYLRFCVKSWTKYVLASRLFCVLRLQGTPSGLNLLLQGGKALLRTASRRDH